MRQSFAVIVLAAAFGLGGCAGGNARFERALASPEPPSDFALSATVLRPVPLAWAAGVRVAGAPTGAADRPARYIVEADSVLRAATGAGAQETTYPPRTRQLTRAQREQLWRELAATPLVDVDHPARAGRAPSIDEASEASGGKTTWVIEFSAAGRRQTLVIHEGGEGEAEARRLVESMARLAWFAR
ncbi:MAG: hypothetical protein KF699_15675 [Phycisphaeraceae bacterium]|nr:hypothetical protein [Phycisphaeraceae bacterium]MBX3407004.1 hypothetical protein [Phycisphaeraceae bacterium]